MSVTTYCCKRKVKKLPYVNWNFKFLTKKKKTKTKT